MSRPRVLSADAAKIHTDVGGCDQNSSLSHKDREHWTAFPIAPSFFRILLERENAVNSVRRATKVISGTSTNFLYDLANPVQELSGSTPTANLLTGGLDEYFSRTDASGTWSFLTDALGSTAVLADGAGTLQTQYTFDPFGSTTPSGTSSTNTLAYTGRESDGTGLYFNRARYYNPQLERFISEDPAGLTGGGPTLYSYVANSPTNFSDPFGLTKCVHTPNAYECWDWSPGSYNVIEVNDPQPHTIPMSTVPLIPPRSPKPPNAMAGRNCGFGAAIAETAIGGVAILGDVALSWYLAPILAEEGLTGALDWTHIGPVLVPGAILYVNGIGDITAHCFDP